MTITVLVGIPFPENFTNRFTASVLGIGQCVGAFNQKVCPSTARCLVIIYNLHWKFFVNFLQWATLFCFWTFSTLLGLNVKPRTSPGPGLDPHQIVVIALFVAVVPKSYLLP